MANPYSERPSNLTEGNKKSEYTQIVILSTNNVKRVQGFAGGA